ncbi:hypothetical protein MHYP_G00256980 [Metynnis hypsauchen]
MLTLRKGADASTGVFISEFLQEMLKEKILDILHLVTTEMHSLSKKVPVRGRLVYSGATCRLSKRSKMNSGQEMNFTFVDDENWTLPNVTKEYVVPRSNITYVGFYLHQPSVAAIFIVSYLLIFLVCMVGNGVVCFIVLRSKNMRTVTNLFILNLAVSDLLVGIFCMPTTLLDNIITGQCNAVTL